MPLVKCHECGGQVSDKALACPHCGAPIRLQDDKKICPECGCQNEENAVRCSSCGYPFEQMESYDNKASTEEYSLVTSANSQEELDVNSLSNEVYSESVVNDNNIRICPNCGRRVSMDDNFCTFCGFNFDDITDNVTDSSMETDNVVDDEADDTNKKRRWLSIGLCVLIVVLLVCIFVIYSSHKSNVSKGKSNVAAMDTTVVEDVYGDTIAEDSWQLMQYEGFMINDEGKGNSLEITFEQNGQETRNCIYKNTDLGGKISMQASVTDNTYTFSGKDGSNDFTIRINRFDLKGDGYDGNKSFTVIVNNKSGNTTIRHYTTLLDMSSRGNTDMSGYIYLYKGYGYYVNTGASVKYYLQQTSYDSATGSCVLDAYSTDGDYVGKFFGRCQKTSYYDEECNEHKEKNFSGTFEASEGNTRSFDFYEN